MFDLKPGMLHGCFALQPNVFEGPRYDALADISKAATLLCYQPTHNIGEGLKVAMEWYVQHLTQQGKT